MARPTLTYLAAKFRMRLSADIAGYLAGSASRDFGTLVQQCRDIEDYYSTSKAKKVKVAEATKIVAGGSTSWRDRKYGNKGKGKQMAARQAPNQFKRTSASGDAARPPAPKYSRCEKTHFGPCSTGQLICFQCGEEGHFSRECLSATARVTAVQAVPLQMVPVSPT